MIDGKMQDDATWKQCKVMVDAGRDAGQEGPGAGEGLRALEGEARRTRAWVPTAILEAMTQENVEIVRRVYEQGHAKSSCLAV